MPEQTAMPPAIVHGASSLPSVVVNSYNVELKDDEGFLGDRASKGAFRDIIENWRKPLRRAGNDPFGDEPSEEISKKKLDSLLAEGDPTAGGIVQSAIEDFAQELALVIRRFLKLKAWRDTECIVIGGGFSASRVGELAIGRAAVILKADKVPVDLQPVRNEPDEAGLLGAAHLAPRWMFEAHDAILGVDIGGTNIRAGVVALNLKKAADLSKAFVWKFELWRHGDEENVKRSDAVAELVAMIERLIGPPPKKACDWRRSSVSVAPALSKRTARSTAAPTTFRATGITRASICRISCTKPYRPLASTRPSSCCTTTPWCRGSAKRRSCRSSSTGVCSPSAPASAMPASPIARWPARIDDPRAATTISPTQIALGRKV